MHTYLPDQIVAGGVSGGLLGIALIGAIVIVIIVSIIIKKNQRKLPVNVTPTSSITLLDSQRRDSENQPQQHGRDLQQASADPSQSNQDTRALPDYLHVAQKMFPPSVTHSAVDIQSPTVSELPAEPGPSVVEDSCNTSTLSFHSAYTNSSYRQSEALDEIVGASDVKLDKLTVAHSAVSLATEQSPKHEHHSELQIDEFSHDNDTSDPSTIQQGQDESIQQEDASLNTTRSPIISHKASKPSTSPLERPTRSHTETQPSNLDVEQPCLGSQPRPNSRGQNTKAPSKTPNLDPLRAPFHSRLHRPSISSGSGAVPPKPISLGIAPSAQPPSNKSAHSSPSGVLTSPHSNLPPLRQSPRQYPNSTAQGKLVPITTPGTPLHAQEPSPVLPPSDAKHQDVPHPGSRLRRPSVYPTLRSGQPQLPTIKGLSQSEGSAPTTRVHRPLSDPAPTQPPQPTKAQTHSDAESSDLPRIRRPSKVPIPSPTISSPESTINHSVQTPSDANVTRPISRLRRPSTPSHSLTSTKPRNELGMPVTTPSVNVNPRPIESTVIDTTLGLHQQSHSPTETNSTTDSSTTHVGVRSRLRTLQSRIPNRETMTHAAVEAKPLASLKEESPSTSTDTEHFVTPPVKPRRTLSTGRPRAKLPPRKPIEPRSCTRKSNIKL